MLARGSALSPSCSASTNAAANVQVLAAHDALTREHIVEGCLRFRERTVQRLLHRALHVFANFGVVEMDPADSIGALRGQ